MNGARLTMQDYLRPNHVLTLKEQIEIFSYRSKMNEFNFNFKGLKDEESCVCTIKLSNPHIFQCRILNEFKDHELKYEDILNGTLHQQKNILNTMKKNIKTTEKLPWQLEPTIDYCFNALLKDQYIYIYIQYESEQ